MEKWVTHSLSKVTELWTTSEGMGCVIIVIVSVVFIFITVYHYNLFHCALTLELNNDVLL